MTSYRFYASVGARRASSSSAAFSDVSGARAQMKGVMNNYRKLLSHIEKVTPEILYEALLPTFEKSQEYVPVDTGKLKESGFLVVTEFRGNPSVEIGYGRGGIPPYAVRVHENMEWQHESPTRAKYLQAALDEDAPEIQRRIFAGLKRIGF